jgi:hypothetical protein
VTSISHVVLVSWESGKEIRAEELVRPAIRGFVGTTPGRALPTLDRFRS